MSSLTSMNEKARSRKVSLVKIRSTKRLRFFTSLGSNTYEKEVKFFVDNLEIDGVVYTATTGSLVSNSFKYDVTTNKLTFKTNGVNPELVYVVPTFIHFYSNLPLILPYDLNNGSDVEYEPRLSDIGAIKLEIDYEQTGIALESDSSIVLENNDGYFDDIFDTHIWENKEVEYYYWYENLLPSEAKLIYKGLIQDKSFSPKSIKFTVKDKFLTLRDNLKLNLFDTGDGSYDGDLFLKPKRRIYGEVSKLKTTGTDKLKGSFNGSGVISGIQATTSLTGVGTSFLKDLCQGDTLKVTLLDGSTLELGIQDILSDTSAITSEEISSDFTDLSYVVSTSIYSKHFNRRWNISGHKLTELSQSILEVVTPSMFRVNSIDGYEVGNLVELNSNRYTIVRAYSDKIVLNQNVSPLPNNGDLIKKVPCYKAYFGPKELTYKVHYDLENNSSDATLVIYNTAEANLTIPVVTSYDLIFTNGSRVVTSPSAIDFSKVFNPRDLIKPSGVTYSTYYEVLIATETELRLREVFNDITITTSGLHKKVDYIKDDSLIAVDCIGIAKTTGEWIRYPSEVVEHLLTKDAEQIVNTASFLEARTDAEFKIGIYFPETIGNESPVIRDCITTVNKSVFGSLFYDEDYNFKYSILNSNKPESLKVLYEDDVIGYDVITKNRIINRAKINYKYHTDLVTGEVTTDSLTMTSEFVDKLIKFSKEEILDTYLFNESDAQVILERFLFFNSLTNSIVRIKGKLNLASLNLNDVVKLELDRIYRRYSGGDRTKLGLINFLEKDENSCTIQVNDLGGIFNRVPSIAPDTLSDFSGSTPDSIAKYGYIVDNLTETPSNDETYLGSNLIG